MIYISNRFQTLLVLLLTLSGGVAKAQTPDANGIIYVKPEATGTGDGSSWANATANLKAAITATGASKVYAANGSYHVQDLGTINMKNGVEIYGGFDPVNNVTDWTTRFLPNKQIGDFDVWWQTEGSVIDGTDWNGVSEEYIVISNNDLDNTAVLDGFSIVGGGANHSGQNAGGIVNNNASPTLRNLMIAGNSGLGGGGMSNTNSSPVVTDVVMNYNHTNYAVSGEFGEGGGVRNKGNSSPVFTNTLFINNDAMTDFKGGAVFHSGTGTATFTNCTFDNNTAGVANPGSQMLSNSVTVDATTDGTVSFINSIVFGAVYGTYTAQHSMIQGHVDISDGNMDADVYLQDDIFISPITGITANIGNYGLRKNAAVINAGSNTLFPGLNAGSKDIKGNSRVLKYNNSGVIDMGAYENQYEEIVPTGSIVYVKPIATGEKDGSSWANATADLQGAINVENVQKVFVSVGNYDVPSPNSFAMKNGVEIYGGFDPNNGIVDLSNTRILPNHGYSQGSVLNGKNERPVVFNDNNSLTASAILDGFTIKNGYRNTNGGGICNNYASPTLRNLVVTLNNADNGGAGMFNFHASPILSNAIFTENNAGNIGGGVVNSNSSPVFTNVSIVKNTATAFGGGMFHLGTGNAVLNSVTIAGNTPDAVNINTGIVSVGNSIVYGGISGPYFAQYSLIQGEISTTNGNMDATGITETDIFSDPTNNDYTLKESAVVINQGSNGLFAGLDVNTLDLAGNERVYNFANGGIIDIGAYEFGVNIKPDANGTIYVTTSGTGNGSSWENSTSDLHNAIHTTGVKKVFVKIGEYKVGDNSFVMRNNVEIYGGFDPESGIRNLNDNRILPNHGNAEGSVLNGENVRPVIFNNSNGLTNSAILDGFTIKNGSYWDGGGIFIRGSSPTLTNLVIKENKAGFRGGGIFIVYDVDPVILLAKPLITNTIIKNNYAVLGGGIFNWSSAELRNVEITNNILYADGQGGGVCNHGEQMDFYNCTVAGNAYSAVFNHLSSTNITTTYFYNSIVFGSLSANGSYAFNTLSATDDIETIFVDPQAGYYRLKTGSPAIDAGSNSLYAGLDENTVDLAGNPRLKNIKIDQGPYEYQSDIAGIVVIVPDANGVAYVKKDANGDGSSWANATGSLLRAIDGTNVQKVFVAVGAYPIAIGESLVMKNNVAVYGGFDPENGIDDLSDERILPDVQNSNIGSILNANGVRRVVQNIFTIANPLDNTAILDGFTLTGGKTTTNGGAIYNKYASPVFTNLVIRNNNAQFGGGVYNRNSNPQLRNIHITNNTAVWDGGGIYNKESSPLMLNISITKNAANYGGGVFNQTSASPPMTNVLIAENSSGNDAGGVYNDDRSLPVLTNTTIASNTAVSQSKAIHNRSASVSINNSIVYGGIGNQNGGTFTMQYSLVEGNTNPTNGNIDATGITVTGIFTDPSAGDYTLTSGSPAINAGDNSLFSNLDATTQDLAGSPRLLGTTIDLGAYESPFGALPVRWISFNGRLNDQRQAVLMWKTDETNVLRYEVERSANGRDFRTIGTVAAGKTGSGSYSLIDRAPVSGRAYYRIRQIDTDAVFSYSKIISLNYTGHSKLLAYPNPAKENVIIELSQDYIGSSVRLISISGVELQQLKVDKQMVTIALGQYPSGIYLLYTFDGKVARIVKN